jgi:hypothetical protein
MYTNSKRILTVSYCDIYNVDPIAKFLFQRNHQFWTDVKIFKNTNYVGYNVITDDKNIPTCM